MKILSVGTALPPHRYDQQGLLQAITALWSRHHHNPRRVAQLHRAVQVGGRNLALSLDEYESLDFGQANDAFIEVGTELAEQALGGALRQAGRRPEDLDAIFFTTVTGLAVPTIDARLINRMGLRSEVRRTPMFGLGCVAGAAGISRMADYLRAWPTHTAALVSVELCSLTLQADDLSIPNLIASGLFGDGAAAVVASGDARYREDPSGEGAGPRVVAWQSRFYPDTERVMGWDIGQGGFRIVLSAQVPDMVERHMRQDVDAFLATRGLSRDDIHTWVCHPGGPKVLQAFERALATPPGALDLTWRSLRDVGNLSSASVLFVLRDTLAERPPPPGALGMMLAMGPGFCAELVLLEW